MKKDSVFWMPRNPNLFEGESVLADLLNLYKVTADQNNILVDFVANKRSGSPILNHIPAQDMHKIIFLIRRGYLAVNKDGSTANRPLPPPFNPWNAS